MTSHPMVYADWRWAGRTKPVRAGKSRGVEVSPVSKR